jgi:hypothetical protein
MDHEYSFLMHEGINILGTQISQGSNFLVPNFLGTKKVRGPNDIGYHFSYSLQVQVGTYLLANPGQVIAWRQFLFHENEYEPLPTQILF